MKHIANRICEALRYAEVVESQLQFSTDWLGKSRSYLAVLKAVDGQDISRDAAQTLVATLDAWLGDQTCAEPSNPRLVHAILEGKDAVEALRNRLDDESPNI